MTTYNNNNKHSSTFTSGPVCHESKKINDVPHALMEISETTAIMEKRIAELLEKLGTVLGPDRSGPLNDSCDKNPEPIVAPLANNLKNLNDTLKGFNLKLFSILDRIQL